jgi:hypothetical protein
LVLSAPTGKWFDRIFIIQFENHSENEVLADPNFNKWREKGRSCLNYFAIAHPSQPNYIAQAAGDTCGVTDDAVHSLSQTCLADLMEPAGLSWKLYQEDYPGNCDNRATIGRYARKHNPFISFETVRKNATRCAKIVNSDELDADLAAGSLPQFSYYTPNMDNDGHDTSVKYAGNWLDGFLTQRSGLFPTNTLIVVSWDEDDYTEENQIFVFFLDPQATLFAPGSDDHTLYNHYSLLASIEQNWNLGNLGRGDANATVYTFEDLKHPTIFP